MSAPLKSYGILERASAASVAERAAEQITRLGYTVFDAGLSAPEIANLATCFDRAHGHYLALYGRDYLRARDEHNTMRLPLALDLAFLDLARNEQLLALVARLISGAFILNQQNGIVNPCGEGYNQDAWHRDLPYQHFVCSRPLAINALYCVDDFTLENGATSVVPASHLREGFPSDAYVAEHARQITAPAGSFIVLDCMTYHCGTRNASSHARRAVNHVFTIPYIKQQISIPAALRDADLDEATRKLLGYTYQAASGVAAYLEERT